jgi:hypothetical protein
VHTQAAYDNTSEIELKNGDVPAPGEPELSRFSVGTKVAKQFENNNQQLVWFEGAVQRFDEDDSLYWVLYTDVDFEDMDEVEVRDAVHNHRVHLQQDEVTVSATTSIASPVTSVNVDMTDTSRSVAEDAPPAADASVTNSLHPSSSVPSELAIAMQAMTAAAERLATAATRIEAAVLTQRIDQPQQPQQIVTVPNWQMRYYWQHVRLQQQQQQQRLVYYQQQQRLSHWQQQQQQMHSFRWQCRRYDGAGL